LPFISHATPTAHPHTLSLHDALPICEQISKKRKNFHYTENSVPHPKGGAEQRSLVEAAELDIIALSACQKSKREVHLIDKVALRDRKSTRLNSSHVSISYAVFCLKKK